VVNNEFDIAIVGMAGRFPGAANVDEFWHNLVKGVESITRLSDDDMLRSGVPRGYLQKPNYVKAAPILDEPGHFDAGFFGFSPMEARTMDPQHRILPELAHEALENAGYDPDRYQGHIGVFTGSAMNTYFMSSGLNGRFAEDYIPTLIVDDKRFLEHPSLLQAQSERDRASRFRRPAPLLSSPSSTRSSGRDCRARSSARTPSGSNSTRWRTTSPTSSARSPCPARSNAGR
jgi:hypothetical protein